MTEKTLADIGDPTPVTQPEVPSWFLADGIPGTGERPDYLEPKYKSVAEQAKAYKEAQKLLGAQGPAPENYDFSAVQDHINQDHDIIKDFIAFAKDNRLSQSTVEKTLKTWVDYEKAQLPDVDTEIAKLGSDGMQKVTTVQNWMKNNLSKDAVNALSKLPVRAEVITMLDEMRQLHARTQARLPAGENATQGFKKETKADIFNEQKQNYARYNTDKNYRDQISQRYAIAEGED